MCSGRISTSSSWRPRFGNFTVVIDAMAPPSVRSERGKLRTRAVSALVLASAVLGATVAGYWPFAVLIAVLGALMCWAWAQICGGRSEEHTSELQSLMRISYAVFCLKKKK